MYSIKGDIVMLQTLGSNVPVDMVSWAGTELTPSTFPIFREPSSSVPCPHDAGRGSSAL